MSAPGKNRGGGVLPINAAATRKAAQPQRPGRGAPAPKSRLIVRRLPPGLIESEFWAALGEEWQLGKGKVDWADFKDGKVSKDPAKPSKPARAYLKLKEQALLDALSAKVRSTTFQDAKNTTKDPCLLGPPSLEFAPYNKIATGRVRHDGRQGTIDQDQEFIDFLQSLTEPISKPVADGTEGETKEKVTTTPLVQYLKEKKANKAKEAAEKKNAKQREAKEAKDKKTSTVVVKGSTPAAEKARVAKATKDAVTAINKSVASMQATKQPVPAVKPDTKGSPSTPVDAPAGPTSPAKRERERGNASAAARMLQRDLGLAPRSPRAGRAAPTSPAVSKAEPATASNKTASGTASAQEQETASTPGSAGPPTGPRNARVTSAAVSKPTATLAARPTKVLPQPSAGAKSAFLKHANPSQGVTEELLRTAFEAFGIVTKCEIDKKKGLGYVDFEDTETLRRAMHASPIKVGNSNVVVLENRNVKKSQPPALTAASAVTQSPVLKSTAPAANATASASNTASPVPTTTLPATSTPAAQSEPVTAPSALSTSTPSSPTVTTVPPTAPRGAARGGGRGSIRGNPAPRGNFTPPGRGGPRGGFRGGRGSFGPRGGRAAAQAVAAANTPATPSQNQAPGPPAASTGGNAGGEK